MELVAVGPEGREEDGATPRPHRRLQLLRLQAVEEREEREVGGARRRVVAREARAFLRLDARRSGRSRRRGDRTAGSPPPPTPRRGDA